MSRAVLACGLLVWAGAWCLGAEIGRKPAAVKADTADSVAALRAMGVEVKTDRQGRVTEIVLSAEHGDEVLARAAPLGSLRRLNATGSKVSGAGLRHLRAVGRLEELWLAGTRLDDAGLVHLAALPGLRKLSLASLSITDAGLAHVGRLGKLTHLYLDDTRVTMEGLENLKLPKRLRVLSLGGVRIGMPGRERFRRAFPGLSVFPLDPPGVVDLPAQDGFEASETPVLAGSDEDKLQGAWQAVSAQVDGKAVGKEELARTSITFRGHKVTRQPMKPLLVKDPDDPEGRPWRVDQDTIAYTYWVDPISEPRRLDIVVGRSGRLVEIPFGFENVEVPVTDQCIYRLKGDHLVICFGTRRRPARFATRKGDGFRLVVYRRAAAEKK